MSTYDRIVFLLPFPVVINVEITEEIYKFYRRCEVAKTIVIMYNALKFEITGPVSPSSRWTIQIDDSTLVWERGGGATINFISWKYTLEQGGEASLLYDGTYIGIG